METSQAKKGNWSRNAVTLTHTGITLGRHFSIFVNLNLNIDPGIYAVQVQTLVDRMRGRIERKAKLTTPPSP